MRDTFGIHLGYMRDTYLGGLGECIDAMYRQLPWGKAKLQGRAVRVEARGQGWKALPHPRAQHWLLLPGGLPKGFLPSDTAEGDEVEQGEEDEQEDDVVGDDDQEAQHSPQPRSRREARELLRLLCLLWHLPRHLRHVATPRSRPSAHPSAAASRARATYPRMYPYVSDTYRECILCVMYLRVI